MRIRFIGENMKIYECLNMDSKLQKKARSQIRICIQQFRMSNNNNEELKIHHIFESMLFRIVLMLFFIKKDKKKHYRLKRKSVYLCILPGKDFNIHIKKISESSVSFSFLANISPLSKSTSNPSKSNLEISKTPYDKCTNIVIERKLILV